MWLRQPDGLAPTERSATSCAIATIPQCRATGSLPPAANSAATAATSTQSATGWLLTGLSLSPERLRISRNDGGGVQPSDLPNPQSPNPNHQSFDPIQPQAFQSRLIPRVSRAELPAFEELYRQHSARLFSLAWRMCGTRADAEDLLQEIFLLAYRKLPDFRGDASVGTWLYRLAMNRCLDHLKSRQTRTMGVTTPLDETMMGTNHNAGDGRVNRLDLERAIAQLPEGARAAFLLHDVEGFQHQEIAAILGISEGTSKSQVHKARLRLRTLLAATS